MRNVVLNDTRSNPDIMVAFTPAELGLPAVLRGRPVKEYMIGKYPACMIDGLPYSMPYQKPATDVNHDEAIELCEAKGPGWHLLTNDEWAALARLSVESGHKVRRNTSNGGSSHSHPDEHGVLIDGGFGKTFTGSGPAAWNHDGTPEGVADLVGNIWEHVGGVRFVDGAVQIIPDNGAAAGVDQGPDSPEWQNVYTCDGDPVYYHVGDGTITLKPYAPDQMEYGSEAFGDLETAGLDVPEKLIELGLYPATGFNGDDRFWLDTDGGRCVYRGGYWAYGAIAGVFSLSGYSSRSDSDGGIGFRVAYVRYSDNLDNLDNLEDDEARTEAAAKNDAKHAPASLPHYLRFVIARRIAQLTEIGDVAEFEHLLGLVERASDDELREALSLAWALSELDVMLGDDDANERR